MAFGVELECAGEAFGGLGGAQEVAGFFAVDEGAFGDECLKGAAQGGTLLGGDAELPGEFGFRERGGGVGTKVGEDFFPYVFARHVCSMVGERGLCNGI